MELVLCVGLIVVVEPANLAILSTQNLLGTTNMLEWVHTYHIQTPE